MTLKLTPLVKGSGPTVLLQRPIYLVGRHPECDLRLEIPKISRRHCCFALAYDRLMIRDLGSRNGVRVNGRDVTETQLFRGDEVAIGPLIFRVEQDVEPGTATPKSPPGRERPAAPEVELVPLDDV
ncbi:FHA domain-containing protein [Paludisphaera mucosa]|uniref:FHA domain-containing protein n=1 Tax=Paludisphaera mucosa TaxID=3030827 RepID=A0ABT6F7D2_9BACT|nr:FHA domain-containing protein [Paludisphaera mucosa]MDG3003313.1 FHA domain-containing protein [Paludisphaera mucosa]